MAVDRWKLDSNTDNTTQPMRHTQSTRAADSAPSECTNTQTPSIGYVSLLPLLFAFTVSCPSLRGAASTASHSKNTRRN